MTKKGFTLVELAIVLVIVGLLIGSILVARSMIETAKINAEIRQLQQFDIALTNFRQKFKCLPGDCYKYFGGYSPKQSTLDNGILDGAGGTQPLGNAWPESLYFFPQLQSSGMLQGDYSSNMVYNSGPGTPFPTAVLGDKPYYGIFADQDSNQNVYWSLSVSAPPGTGDSWLDLISPGYLFGVNRVMALDRKLDDGMPFAGDVQSIVDPRGDSGTGFPGLRTGGSGDGNGPCVKGGSFTVSATDQYEANAIGVACKIVVKSTATM